MRGLIALGTRCRAFSIIAYAAPCVLVWGYYLWVFWPGLMSHDSFYQWFQLTNGSFDNWHPAFHTMNNWLITRIWNSPGAVALVQIIALSAVVGWGLAMMRQKGMPRWIAIALSLVMAFSPANGATVITLWKDIPYSICLLLMGLLMVEIVSSGGAWLDRRWAWAFLGFVAALTALYRHNGPPIVFGTMAVILLIYRQKWPKLALALMLAVGCWIGVRGPLYSCVGVKPMPGFLTIFPMLHHIAAHTDAGTPLSADQQALLAGVHPLMNGKWPYNPTIAALMCDYKFNAEQVDAHRSELIRLFLSLAWQRPMVNLKHMIRSGAMVWRISEPCMMIACSIVDDKAVRMDPEIRNDPRQLIDGKTVEVARPLPPGLAASLKPEWAWFIWGPGMSLYFLLLGVTIGAVRARQWQYLLFALPAVLQSLSLVMVCPSSDYRYQWGVCLTSVLLGNFALWRVPRRISTCGNTILFKKWDISQTEPIEDSRKIA